MMTQFCEKKCVNRPTVLEARNIFYIEGTLENMHLIAAGSVVELLEHKTYAGLS